MTPASSPVRLNTHLWNPLGDRRALLLHGLGSDGNCWWRLASQLADAGWLVLAPDLRSHGSSPTALDHRVGTLAGDVALLGDRWDLVVGHSLGGSVAALLLAEPDFAPAAVLVDPVLHLAGSRHARVHVEQRGDVGQLDPARVAAEHPDWDERDVARKVLAARQVTPDVVDAVMHDNEPLDVTAASAAWQSRVHLLAADPERGGLLDPGLAERLAHHDEVSAEVVAGAGHSVHRDRPDVVRDAVSRVLGCPTVEQTPEDRP